MGALLLSAPAALADSGPVPAFTPGDIVVWNDADDELATSTCNKSDLYADAVNDAIASYGDRFDYVVTFTKFPPGPCGPSTTVPDYDGYLNHALGLGTPPNPGVSQWNRNIEFGVSSQRLRGVISMWDLWSHGARSPVASTLTQEYIHSAGVYLGSFSNGRSFAGDGASCGRAVHWNFRLDAGGSSMEIREWKGGPASRIGSAGEDPVLLGSTTSINSDIPGSHYSYPDLYLFGIVTADEMDSRSSELRYMDDDGSGLCTTPHNGPISTWSSVDIITSDDPVMGTPVGPRMPSADKAPKDLTTLVILLHRPGDLPTDEEKSQIAVMVNTMMDNVYLGTLERATMRTTLPRDCNGNGIEDEKDIDVGGFADCDANRVPDVCQSPDDCNNNGQQDICEIGPGQNDCNDNDVPDDCDIALGTSADSPPDGVPDECQRPVLFVDKSAGGAGHGTSWTDAYVSLQRALRVAAAGEANVQEIWVAQGVYLPTQDGQRWKAFYLVDGLDVYGGFDGTETLRNQRDPVTNPTILSGDLAGNDAAGFVGAGENSLHVVIADGVGPATVLDGVTVRGGYADLGADSYGAGMAVYNGSPVLRNVVFKSNRAVQVANSPLSGSGAALGIINDSRPTVEDCTFDGNQSDDNGGAVIVFDSAPTITGSQFLANSAGSSGGGMFVTGTAAGTSVYNSIVVANTADFGGGLAIDSPGVRIRNVTAAGNIASTGGGGTFFSFNVEPDVVNSVFDSNTPNDLGGGSNNMTVTYSRVDNLTTWPGAGNTSGNALLLVAPDPGPDGSWDGVDDDLGDVRLALSSPAIDAGNSLQVPPSAILDAFGNPRRANVGAVPNTGLGGPAVVDMGAYEYPGTGADGDGDGFENAFDNCPSNANPGQQDADQDGTGDACDTCTDTDADGFGDAGFAANTCPQDSCPGFDDAVSADGDAVPDGCDNCPSNSNNAQADSDGDGIGNACDNCTGVVNPRQEDCNADGQGDVCDADAGEVDPDLDGVCSDVDLCPGVWNPTQEDCNGDGQGDLCETTPGEEDPDGDGICTASDPCPLVPEDTQNGVDSDGDTILNICDPCPDPASIDDDLDGICDETDLCNGHDDNVDSDADGVPDGCDRDDDDDFTEDGLDCASTDATAFLSPGPMPGLLFPDTDTIVWANIAPGFGSGTVYDIMRGLVSELPVGSGAGESCIAQGNTASTLDVSEDPALGQVYYYLGRLRNTCANGTWQTPPPSPTRVYTGCD
jgi:hypothetical protein